jgi:hypothetical protein
MTHYWEKPCAANGLRSYRYLGQYGYIMVAAEDTRQALVEAGRSTDPATVTINRLQEWVLDHYEDCQP